MPQFKSRFQRLTKVNLPKFTGTRVLMLPILLEDINSLPNDLIHYRGTLEELIAISPTQQGVAYLTIDEKTVPVGETLRQRGLHVDGFGPKGINDCIWSAHGLRACISQLWSEGEKRWHHNAAGIRGMVTVSSPEGCRAWNKDFLGEIKINGSCEHIRDLFPEEEATVFEAGIAYWCNSTCVHESLPMLTSTERTFVRLSMPSDAPWYRGFTRNPKGCEQLTENLENLRK